MTEELKTLSDLKERFGARPRAEEGEEQDRFVSYLDLRQEAIKWIKEIENEKSIIHSWKGLGCLPWITHFFNITDEELVSTP